MNGESPAQGRASADALNVDGKSTQGEGRTDEAGPRFGICDPRAAAMKISGPALRLYVAMTRYADGRTRIARPGQLRLCDDLRWTYTGGKPDRRRLHRVLEELEQAGLVRRHGTHPLGDGKWVNRYLVAPFPIDADLSSASAAQVHADQSSASSRHDADDPARTMRTIQGSNADRWSAPSKQFSSNQSSSERRYLEDREELDRIAVAHNMQTASDEELRAVRDREAAHA